METAGKRDDAPAVQFADERFAGMSGNRRLRHAGDLLVRDGPGVDSVAQHAAEARAQNDRGVDRPAGSFAQQTPRPRRRASCFISSRRSRNGREQIRAGHCRLEPPGPTAVTASVATSPSFPPLASVPSGGSGCTSTNGTGLVVCAVSGLPSCVDFFFGVAVIGGDRKHAAGGEHRVVRAVPGTRRAFRRRRSSAAHMPVWPTMSAFA